MDYKILRLPAVKEVTGLSRSSIYQMMVDGTFPLSCKLKTNAVGWLESEIQNWIKSKINQRIVNVGEQP